MFMVDVCSFVVVYCCLLLFIDVTRCFLLLVLVYCCSLFVVESIVVYCFLCLSWVAHSFLSLLISNLRFIVHPVLFSLMLSMLPVLL